MTAPRPLAIGLTPLETRREVVLHLATRSAQLGYEAFFLAVGWGHDAPVLLTEVATRTQIDAQVAANDAAAERAKESDERRANLMAS